uniref:Uncharacterized protein n=1 Tax=Solanum tuberosum TaxID=4113 RepID=M1E0B4_SOLTU
MPTSRFAEWFGVPDTSSQTGREVNSPPTLIFSFNYPYLLVLLATFIIFAFRTMLGFVWWGGTFTPTLLGSIYHVLDAYLCYRCNEGKGARQGQYRAKRSKKAERVEVKQGWCSPKPPGDWSIALQLAKSSIRPAHGQDQFGNKKGYSVKRRLDQLWRLSPPKVTE